MQSIAFVGKIVKKDMHGTGDKAVLKLRLAVRKSYVTKEDQEAGKVNTFVPLVVFGKMAETIDQYFPEGRGIAVYNCEYITSEYTDKNGDKRYGHDFKVGGFGFLPDGEGDNGNGKKGSKDSDRKRRRDDDDDDDDDRRSRRSRRRDDDDDDDDRRSRRSRRRDDDDDGYDDDDDTPF